MNFQFYLLSRSEVIKLIYESNYWYLNKWHRNGRSVNLKNPCGLKIMWLNGENEDNDAKHEAFHNPVASCLVDSKNIMWKKIMDD